MKAPAFQFYAAEYLADEHVQLMSLEEEGAYIRLLAFCWREGSIPNDEKMLSRLCKGASTTVIRVVQARFNQSSHDGTRLVHTRLEQEREKQRVWREKSAEGGRASAGKRKTRKPISREQGGSTTLVPTRLKGGSTLQSSSSSSIASSSSITSSEVKTTARATRLPDDFTLSDSMRDWAKSETPHVDLNRALSEFVDYWRGVPGSRGTKLDWPATWRNRMRELENRAPRNGHASRVDMSLAATRELLAESEAQKNGR